MGEDEEKRQELLAFGKSEKKDVTPSLMSVIQDMCDTGVPVFEWSEIKPLGTVATKTKRRSALNLSF